jgi:glycosyltransferase involved in cell wall biosynthesis
MNQAPPPPTIAILIPTFNEDASLGRTLISVLSEITPHERLIVADGGSTDRTCRVAEQHGACLMQASRKGRGCQVAEALTHIDEDVVLIVHADMVLPEGTCERIRQWLVEHPDCPGGCLGHRFSGTRWVYRLVEGWDRRRGRRGISYGDQAQFFRRELLERHGGFPDQPIMEDLELSRRMLALGKPAYLDCPVVVSPRRFEHLGWWRTASTNLLFRLAYRMGGPRVCEKLHRRYYDGA